MTPLLLARRRSGHLVQPEWARRGEQRHPAHHRADATVILKTVEASVRSRSVNTGSGRAFASTAKCRHGDAVPPRQIMQMRTGTGLHWARLGLRVWNIGLVILSARFSIEKGGVEHVVEVDDFCRAVRGI